MIIMKTNQILIRTEAFIQRTKDGYFNATKLIDFYNFNSVIKKQLGNYQKNQATIEYSKLLKSEGIDKPTITGRGSGVNAGTWMHPKLFIDFAMWVSVEFKSVVIDYVLDGLIKSRNDAGDYYNEMCAEILEVYSEYYKKKPPIFIYIQEANNIKALVSIEDRNKMSEQELKQITYLQKVNSNLIKKRIGKDKRIKRLKEAAEIVI